MTTPRRPILQSSCALATTAREARFRIDAPIEGRRGTRVVALDDAAATIVRRLAHQPWHAARFYTLPAGAPAPEEGGLALRRTDGSSTTLSAELADADVVVMVATRDSGAAVASHVGEACARAAVMTAGIALGDAQEHHEALVALRPHAQVLLVSGDDDDVAEMLSAIRA